MCAYLDRDINLNSQSVIKHRDSDVDHMVSSILIGQ